MRTPIRLLMAGLGIGPRIVLVFVLVFGCMGSVGLLLMRNSLLPTFDSMEHSFAQEGAKRVVSLFDQEMVSVGNQNRDWAFWDDLYQHMQRPNPVFARSNLGAEAMQSSSLHAIMLVDLQGRVVGFGPRAFSGGAQAQAPDLLAPLLQRWARFPVQPGVTECGMARVAYALNAVCWTGIVQSNGKGPAVGTVVMARELDAHTLKHMAQFAGVTFTLEQLGANHTSAPLPGMLTWELPALQYLPKRELYAEFSKDAMAMQYLLRDLNDTPLSWVRIRMHRELMEQGRRVVVNVLVQLAVLAVATGLVLLMTVHWWLVRPIARLRSAVADVSATRRWDQTLAYERPDEIGALTQGINSLLAVLHEQVGVLETLSSTDALTGIANRRQFDERLAHELVRLGRHSAPLSLLLLDVDHFKLYNDHYGHPAGDAVLRQLGGLLRASCRQQDLPARLGGEEFALLLPDTAAAGAAAMADKVMKALAALAIGHERSLTAPHVTVSIGIVTWSEVLDGGAAELFAQADKALYAAKHSGRQRACVYGTPAVPKL
ncbi:MAG TPA: hypothetical protein DHV01_03755 [Rhodoferax sp.]|uniref:diguanylate cyclase domain-containing protein n=1 Tax=Rhodoferax sp. TaxID=50421 RepID=UPI000A5969EF|nr:diguanylate cyclase [Rhodoferax sp.]HCX80700.1 hypothetical protein [Rhodoferax sp.]